LASQRPFCSLCEFLPLALSLATVVAGGRREEFRYGDRVAERISAGNRVTLVGGAAHFSLTASNLQSGDNGLNLNFDTA